MNQQPSRHIYAGHLAKSNTTLHTNVAKRILCNRIVLLFDQDDAGRAGSEQALARLAHHTFVKILQLPKQGQQPDQLSAEELSALLGSTSCVTPETLGGAQ